MPRKPTLRWMAVAAAALASSPSAPRAPRSVPLRPVRQPARPRARRRPTSRASAPGARPRSPSSTPNNEANAYGVIKDAPRLPNGSVHIPTVFHVVSDHTLSTTEKARWERLIAAQMTVLNDSYSGRTAPDAANSPFRFSLTRIDYTVNARWYTVTPGKTERDMKKALYTGNSETLNVYSANIGGGLLGWSYFPKGYNNGRDFIDGVVMLDESMPGGTPASTPRATP